MKEIEIRRTIKKYFDKYHSYQKILPQMGAGPDFIREGVAIEVKGSRFNKKGCLEQLMDYCQKYVGLEFVAPYNIFDIAFLFQLRWIEQIFDKKVTIYIVISSNGKYKIRKYECVNDLFEKISQNIIHHEKIKKNPFLIADLKGVNVLIKEILFDEIKRIGSEI